MTARVTFAGVRVPKTVVPDLQRATDAGFRVEASPKGDGLVIYPADPDHAPIRWGSREVNPAHESNLRLALRRAGLPDLTPTDTTIDLTGDTPTMSRRRTPSADAPVARETPLPGNGLLAAVPHDERAAAASAFAVQVAGEAGLAPDLCDLLGLLYPTLEYHQRQREKADDVRAALDLAAEQERRADAAERRVATLTEKHQQAVADLRVAREAAAVEKARADALEAALAPLRAVLTASA